MKIAVGLLLLPGLLISAVTDTSPSDTSQSDSLALSAPLENPLPAPSAIEKDSLVALSPQQWTELNGHLSEMGLNADSVSTAGAAYDPVGRKFILIIIDANGQLGKKAITTPQWLFDQIVKPDDVETTAETTVVSIDTVPMEKTSQPAASPGRQDGRTYFIINTTIRATGIYPTSLAMAMPGTDARIITGVAMLTFGGALYGSYAMTRSMSLGYGKVAMMNYGGELGFYYPTLISMIVGEQGNEKYARYISSWGPMIGFPLGITAASFTRFVDNHEYGNAAIMKHFGRIGLAYGFTIPLLWSFENDFKNYLTVSSALSMCLVPAGFYLGKNIVGDRSFSSGRSALVVIAGTMGAATGAIIPSWWESETEELYPAMGLVGSVGGTLLGILYHKPQEYRLWQGVFMGVSATIGAGVGVSIPLLTKAEDYRAYTVGGVFGAWGGLYVGERLSKALFENSARDRRVSYDNIEFPIAWEWPALAGAALTKSRSRDGRPVVKTCLVRISF
jgi:hypothetical protein